jgi:hypothetical protein
MWKLIVIASAVSGFGANIDGGVTVRSIDGFASKGYCLDAAHALHTAIGKPPVWIRMVCVPTGDSR